MKGIGAMAKRVNLGSIRIMNTIAEVPSTRVSVMATSPMPTAIRTASISLVAWAMMSPVLVSWKKLRDKV